ncbi:MAG: hypothetical protein GY847_29045 [Proteobacteria bacterium]|nr:hypothetical protein [Pseudomonadota bacterium]
MNGNNFKQERIEMDIRINTEFRDLLPQLTPEESGALEKSILEEGCRDPLILWDGIIIDGHNRYSICQKHDIDFKTVERSFNSAEDAKDWIDANQLARRNLTPDSFKLALGRRYNRTKKTHGGHLPHKGSGQNVHFPKQQTPDERRFDLAKKYNELKKPQKTAETIAKEHGVNERTVRRAGKFAEQVEADPQLLKAVQVTREPTKKIIKERKKKERIEIIEKQAKEISKATPEMPKGLFNVISIDPPWPYETSAYDSSGFRGVITYPPMSIEQLEKMKIPAADDCIMWLWTTNFFMRQAYQLLSVWGFQEKTILTWAKNKMGIGRWLRSKTEHCILAVKGKPVVNLTNQTTILEAPSREHSRKPDEFYDMVDRLCVGRKIDIFSREKRDNWEQYGNDENKF